MAAPRGPAKGLPVSEATTRKKKRMEYVVHYAKMSICAPNELIVLFAVF